MGSQVVIFAELAYFNTTGPAAGASVAAASVAAGASVPAGASVAAGAPPPQAFNSIERRTIKDTNKVKRFMNYSSFWHKDIGVILTWRICKKFANRSFTRL
jgi:hypothetical protein